MTALDFDVSGIPASKCRMHSRRRIAFEVSLLDDSPRNHVVPCSSQKLNDFKSPHFCRTSGRKYFLIVSFSRYISMYLGAYRQ